MVALVGGFLEEKTLTDRRIFGSSAFPASLLRSVATLNTFCFLMFDISKPDYTATPASAQVPVCGYLREVSGESPLPVSIVTPFFNIDEVFWETYSSVIRQTFQNWEWLIVDDGSTAEISLKILRELEAGMHPQVRVVRHPVNKGLSAARNTGHAESKGGYLIYLDADDLLEATAIEKWVWYLNTHPEASFVNAHSVGFGADEYVWRRGFNESHRFTKENLGTYCALMRRELVPAAGYYDEARRAGLEDWDFWLRCANAGLWGATIPEIHFWYRRRPNHGANWANLTSTGINAFIDSVPERYPHLRLNGVPVLAPAVWTGCARVHNPLKKEGRRIVVIIPWMEVGGADNFNVNMLGQLAKRGWSVTVCTTLPAKNAWLHRFAEITSDIFVLDAFLPVDGYGEFLAYLCESRRPDVVMVSNSRLGYDLVPYLKSRYSGAAYVDYGHAEEPGAPWGGHPGVAALYSGHLDTHIVASDHLKGWMVARGVPAGKVEVARINVDSDHWAPDAGVRASVRQAHGIGETDLVVVYVARIYAAKKPMVLARVADAVCRSAKDGSRVKFVVLGDGPDFTALKAEVSRLSLDKQVYLHGVAKPEEVRRWMQAGDVLFLPTEWEGISLSIYEGMSSGMAVLSADVGGQRELVTQDCGMLIRPDSDSDESARYAELLSEWIKNPEQLKRMKQASRARIQAAFKLSDMGRRIDEILIRSADAPKATSARSDDLYWSSRVAVDASREDIRYLLDRNRHQQASSAIPTAGGADNSAWVEELQKGKDWLESQWKAWMDAAKKKDERIRELELQRKRRGMFKFWTKSKR